MPHRKLYPIGYAARATGLSPHVIRAWERRYRAVAPERTEKNRRLYSLKDIEHLLLLKEARSRGQRIATASVLEETRLKQLQPSAGARADRRDDAVLLPLGPAAEKALLDACFAAVHRLDPAALRAALDSAAVALSRPALLCRLVGPLMEGIGSAWAHGDLRIAHEHLATAVVRDFLHGQLVRTPRPEAAPRLVVGTPAGQSCEIGALAAALTATDWGWRADYFGAGLPAEEIAAAAALTRAAAVALSITCTTGGQAVGGEIGRLRSLIGRRTRLFVGGRAAAAAAPAVEAAGGVIVNGLEEFGRELSRSAEPATA